MSSEQKAIEILQQTTKLGKRLAIECHKRRQDVDVLLVDVLSKLEEPKETVSSDSIFFNLGNIALKQGYDLPDPLQPKPSKIESELAKLVNLPERPME